MKKLSKSLAVVTGEMGVFVFLFAFVMPGAFVFVYTALLEVVQDEMMVAGLTVVSVLMLLVFILRMGYLMKNLDIDLPGKKNT